MQLLCYKLGRLLQVVGMILLPVGVVGNLMPDKPLDLSTSLRISGLGIIVFCLGWLMQQAGRPR